MDERRFNFSWRTLQMSEVSAFIGIGRMGGPMARNLARNANTLGRRVRVYDKSASAITACKDAGADVADTLSEVGD